jgi:hypothetical protein
MATYEFILEEFFTLLFPKTHGSFEAFEAEPGVEDRAATRKVIDDMRRELPAAMSRIFDLELDGTIDSLSAIDRLITPRRAETWMKESDADDLGNFFKVTVSEFAVYFGDMLARDLGGSWRYARMPNWPSSVVVASEVEFHVFDSVIKRCSDDFGHETLRSKYDTFARIVSSKRSASSTAAN